MSVEATMTSAGKLELRSTETGADAKVSIAGATAGQVTNSQQVMVALGFINGQMTLEKAEMPRCILVKHQRVLPR